MLLARRLDISTFVNGVELPSLDWVEEDLGGFLDTFEETVIFGVPSCSLLVGVMAEDLLAVGALDLIFRSTVAVFGEAEDSIMILSLG